MVTFGSSFAGVSFAVLGSSGKFPGIARDQDGIPRWHGDIALATDDDRATLAAKLCLVTWKRPLGTTVTVGHIDAGTGSGTLAVPTTAGTLSSYTAVLVQCDTVLAPGRQASGLVRATVEFVITEGV